MSEVENVAVLKEAYRRWHDSRGVSADYWLSICDENVKFGSLAQGAAAGCRVLRIFRYRAGVCGGE